MARDPRITPEQQAEESAVQFGLVVDFGLTTLLLLNGILGGSLTVLAEGIRAGLQSSVLGMKMTENQDDDRLCPRIRLELAAKTQAIQAGH